MTANVTPSDKKFKSTWLVFDISNMLYRTFYSASSESADTAAGLAIHSALTTLNKYYRLIQPSRVILAIDRTSWRKAYMQRPDRVSALEYKGQRRKNMTEQQAEKYAQFKQHCKDFEQLIADHTTITCLAADSLEADDLMAAVCGTYCSDDRRIVVVSTDSDLWQLMRYPNVEILSPATDKYQSLAEFNNDPEYYVFTKCIRGDSADNIMSAFPRVRQTRIQKAYEDTYERLQLMNEEWTMDGTQVTVGQVFEENQVLISLTHQPPEIRELMVKTAQDGIEKERKFNLRSFLQFLTRHKLRRIIDNIEQYTNLLGRKPSD